MRKELKNKLYVFISEKSLEMPIKSFPMKHFRRKNPLFLELMSKDIQEYDFSLEEIRYIGITIMSNIANLDDFILLQIEWFLVDLHGHKNPLVRNEIAHMLWHIQDNRNNVMLESRKIHDDLLPKLNSSHISIHTYSTPEPAEIKTIQCPHRRDGFHHEDIDPNEESLWFILWEYRKYTKINHYYYMIYVHDLTIQMQFIKRHLIKYDMARNGKCSGTALDIIINEYMLQYIEVNREFLKYFRCLTRIYYYNDHDHMMFPDVYDLMAIYDGICC